MPKAADAKRACIERNTRKYIRHGKPTKQAVAIAYDRCAKRARK